MAAGSSGKHQVLSSEYRIDLPRVRAATEPDAVVHGVAGQVAAIANTRDVVHAPVRFGAVRTTAKAAVAQLTVNITAILPLPDVAAEIIDTRIAECGCGARR